MENVHCRILTVLSFVFGDRSQNEEKKNPEVYIGSHLTIKPPEDCWDSGVEKQISLY